jgi:hypothetical protein
LNFRVQVSQYGVGTVWNTNPFTQTVLAQDFVSTNSIADVIYVDDASRLVSTRVVTVTTNSSGEATVSDVVLNQVTAPITLDIPNAFTVTPLPGQSIRITISGISTPTAVDVTISTGNMLILNSEYIQFTSVNLVDNYVTGLMRGRKKSITNAFVAAGATVQSVLSRDQLPESQYNRWWYDAAGWDGAAWDIDLWDQWFATQTLEQSSTVAATFLKRISP